MGPELGEIYTKPDLKWGDLFRMQKVCFVCVRAGVPTVLSHLNHPSSGPKSFWSTLGDEGFRRRTINTCRVKPAFTKVLLFPWWHLTE